MTFTTSRLRSDRFVRATLDEDLGVGLPGGGHDVTAESVIPADARFSGVMDSRDAIVVAGLPIAAAFFRALDPAIGDRDARRRRRRGRSRARDLMRLAGNARAMLTAERSALNTVQHLSGIATHDPRLCRAMGGHASLLDTRKTIPGLRPLEKYATRMGGAHNHKKNKLFVFGSYEGLRIRPATLAASSYPLTAAERAGDFSSSPTVRDPLNNQPFPNKQIPLSRFDPVAEQMLSKNVMPLPNLPGGQYRVTYPSPQDNNNILVRSDYSAGAHTLEGRYFWNKASSSTYSGDVPAYLPQSTGGLTQTATVGDTWVIRPTLLLQTRLSYMRYINSFYVLNRTHLSDYGSGRCTARRCRPRSR